MRFEAPFKKKTAPDISALIRGRERGREGGEGGGGRVKEREGRERERALFGVWFVLEG